MRPPATHLTGDGDRAVIPTGGVPPAAARRRRRRLTLGICAHCHRPVELSQDHIRLYRRAWHVNCALAAGEPAPAE